jgi:ssDNA-binding Zn-finger/Zn-ribbon topoisomerase 1
MVNKLLLKGIKIMKEKGSRQLHKMLYASSLRTILCKQCNSHMEKKRNRDRTDIFWGCSEYPKCKQTESIKLPENYKEIFKTQGYRTPKRSSLSSIKKRQGISIEG